MNKSSKCKNCQWYGKPYWSILNPCDNCPNENDYKTIITIDREPVFKETKKEYVYVSKEEYTETNNENIRLTAENIELNLELQRKDNNWNELKEWLKNSAAGNWVEYNEAINDVLDKIKELEENK